MQKKTILLVEDNYDDETLTRRAFNKAKIKNELIVARDGVAALDYIFCTGPHSKRDIREQPQAILLDLKLPKVDGLEVLRRIRSDERTKLLPIIILTSSNEEKDLVEGYRGGANSYIVKPMDSAQFEESIRQLSLYWLLLNAPVP